MTSAEQQNYFPTYGMGSVSLFEAAGANPDSMKNSAIVGVSPALDVLPENQDGPLSPFETTCRQDLPRLWSGSGGRARLGAHAVALRGPLLHQSRRRPRVGAHVRRVRRKRSSRSATRYHALTAYGMRLGAGALRRRRDGPPAPVRAGVHVPQVRRPRVPQSDPSSPCSSPGVARPGCNSGGLLFRQDRRVDDRLAGSATRRSRCRSPCAGRSSEGADVERHRRRSRCSSTPSRSRRGKTLAHFARADKACEQTPGCPDAEYLAERGIFDDSWHAIHDRPAAARARRNVSRGERDAMT